MDKKVFVSFLKSPVGSTFYLEGLRATLGLLSGDEDHEVYVAFLGKGVRSALKGVDRSYAVPMVAPILERAVGGCFHVDRVALEEEGFRDSDLDQGFVATAREEIAKMMAQADATLSF